MKTKYVTQAPIWMTILMSQTGTNPPILTVVYNTWGVEPTITRYGAGEYLFTIPGANFGTSTVSTIGQGPGRNIRYIIAPWTTNTKMIQTYNGDTLGDNMLFETLFEIAKYYPTT